MKLTNKGSLFVFSGPSGSGKGTILKEYMKKYGDIFISISMTTREKREYETHEKDYFFTSHQDFSSKIEKGEMLEWAVYLDNYYGTPKAQIDEMLSKGTDVILEIEVQGALKIKEAKPDSVLIFVIPSDLETIRDRLELRNTENSEQIEKRIQTAKEEISKLENYDYMIINDDLKAAVEELRVIILSDRYRTDRRKNIFERAL